MPKPMYLSRAKCPFFLLGRRKEYERRKGETAKGWANRLTREHNKLKKARAAWFSVPLNGAGNLTTGH